MNFQERFCSPSGANPASLQLLFSDLKELNSEALTAAIREFHLSLESVNVELHPTKTFPFIHDELSKSRPVPVLVGLISWADHVVKVLAIDVPLPANAMESCLRPALLPPDFKARAREHKAHVLLYYAGTHSDPLEHYVALSCVAGALSLFGAIVTLNEEARAAVASFALTPDDPDEDMLSTLRGLPMPFLYGGFVKMELTNVPGVWMRTFACPRFNLPNLAIHSNDHSEGERNFHLLSGILGYLRETGLTFEPGERVRIDENLALMVRPPDQTEWWLDSEGTLWVLEPSTGDE